MPPFNIRNSGSESWLGEGISPVINSLVEILMYYLVCTKNSNANRSEAGLQLGLLIFVFLIVKLPFLFFLNLNITIINLVLIQ